MADTSTKKFSRQTLQPWSWDRARRGIFSMPQIFGSANGAPTNRVDLVFQTPRTGNSILMPACMPTRGWI
jgi:hypothetical protein